MEQQGSGLTPPAEPVDPPHNGVGGVYAKTPQIKLLA